MARKELKRARKVKSMTERKKSNADAEAHPHLKRGALRFPRRTRAQIQEHTRLSCTMEHPQISLDSAPAPIRLQNFWKDGLSNFKRFSWHIMKRISRIWREGSRLTTKGKKEDREVEDSEQEMKIALIRGWRKATSIFVLILFLFHFFLDESLWNYVLLFFEYYHKHNISSRETMEQD